MTDQVAGPQVEAAVTPVPPQVVAQPVLSEEQHELVRAALNRIIPASENMPAAGDLEVGSFIERSMSTTPSLRRILLDCIAELAIARFHEISAREQTAVLQRLQAENPDFLVALVEHTYRGYYTHPDVLSKLEYGPPPQPSGRVLPPFDLELLAFQRARQPFWRHA